MTILTLEQIKALAGFTEWPWEMSAHADGATVYALRDGRHGPENAWQAQFSQDGRRLTAAGEVIANAELSRAAPALHATALAQAEEIERLREALRKIADQPYYVSISPDGIPKDALDLLSYWANETQDRVSIARAALEPPA